MPGESLGCPLAGGAPVPMMRFYFRRFPAFNVARTTAAMDRRTSAGKAGQASITDCKLRSISGWFLEFSDKPGDKVFDCSSISPDFTDGF